jgi:sulfite reductase (NADPH) flavoprotein alpha-component
MVLDVAIGDDGRRRVTRSSGDKEHPANLGRLCTKGSTTADMLSAPGRLGDAMIRADRGGEPQHAAVDAAITLTAQRLRAILDEDGPDAISLYVSGQMSLEAQYLANKLAKGFIGTNQIESNSRLCMASAASGYKLSLGADGPPGSYDDFDHADTFLVIGANMADCHPILFLRLLDRVKSGAKLIVVDPRRNATAEKADLFLQIRPGTDLALLNGLLHLLVTDGRIDEQFIAEHTDGWEEMPAFLADYRPDVVAELTGLREQDIRTAAQWIGAAGNWMSCWTMGLNQSTHGTWNTNALCNLHLATGAICRPGSGPFSLTGQPNAMGGREMGYMGPGLPGQRSVAVDEDRRFAEDLWKVPAGTVRSDTGRGTVDLFARMAEGHIRACWIICTNPVASVANRRTVIAGLERAEFVVTQDVFVETETNAYADVVLPAAMWAESEGVLVNSERTLTLAQQAADPPGQALPDWQLIARVACEMGFADGFSYETAEEVFDELRQAWNPKTGYDVRGVDYERLRAQPVQWPSAPGDEGGRNPIRYLNNGVSQHRLVHDDGSVPRLAFATANGRAAFLPRPHLAPDELPDESYPYVLNTGRLQHQWHTLTKTGKVPKLNKLNPGPFIELHPDDATTLGVVAGDSVEVASRRGRAVLPALPSDRVRPGDCFTPFHWNDLFGEYLSINAVTNDAVDPISFQPEFKICAVSLVKVASAPAAPSENPAAPILTAGEEAYFAGFLTGLERRGGLSTRVVPVLPPDAPFVPIHRQWANGLLAGLWTPDGSTAQTSEREILVLWASQTGNAEEIAETLSRRLGAARRVTLRCMADQGIADLPANCDVLIVTSTFGDGESPDNGVDFWEQLNRAYSGKFSGMRFAVLALGDSSYSDFCGHGRKIDARLDALGAERLAAFVECDTDFGPTATSWIDSIEAVVLSTSAKAVSARTPAAPGKTYAQATIVGNVLLSAPSSSKEVRQFTFDLTDTSLSYDVGDVLAVMPSNSVALVDEWLAVLGMVGDEVVELDDRAECTFRQLLTEHRDIAKPAPDLLRFFAERLDDRRLHQQLTPAGSADLAKWLWGRQTIDVIADLNAHRITITPQEWTSILKPLQPRRYSIASSPDRDPHLVRTLISVVRYENASGRRRHGVCSAQLADAAAGASIQVSVQPTRHFRPPANGSAPIIMIGPGTGLAPFLGFLDKRATQGADGKNWLFFGEQRASCDFYFRAELEEMLADGRLDRLDVAFSRDQRAKMYVQDRMREHGARLWSWLRDGAYVFVCGDATRMAKDVDVALREIVSRHGGMCDEDATAFVRQLTVDRRYVRDVY